ncbi:myb-like protein AA [Metopolophium dirhodum]|uniref:myb-like protein AA n=1 Tax=Metopolophium dirhodum TaxID=44670 RepID=UPI00298FEC5F|nr:myb-like protein AA [Metopolophium dirhodum]
MEHSPYSQSPSPSSSLVNFPTPTNLPDIRLHRPFSQMHDLKHLHSPFNLRFMENYPALPAHLLHHLQSPFLHPALDPRVSFSPAGVFQPLGPPSPHHQHPHHQHHSHHAAAAAAASLKGFTSAFAPPSKCYKMDDKQASHAEGAAQQQQQQQQQQPPGSHQQHHQQQQHQLQQQQQQQPVPPSFPYPPRRSPCSPGNMPVSPPSSSAAATMHQQHKDECSDRDTPSSGAVSEDGRMIRSTETTKLYHRRTIFVQL